jgi:hypothetical protein
MICTRSLSWLYCFLLLFRQLVFKHPTLLPALCHIQTLVLGIYVACYTYAAGHPEIQPAAYGIDLGIDTVVTDLFTDPEFCKQRHKHAAARAERLEERTPYTYYSGARD